MPGRDLNQNQGPLSEINVTPLVDVMLVLLVIFMITAPMMTEGLEVNLPQTAAGPLDAQNPPIIISITSQGEIYVDERQVKLESLSAEIAQAEKQRRPRPVYLKADQSVPYGVVVRVMGRLKAAGVEKLGMVTVPPSEPPEGLPTR